MKRYEYLDVNKILEENERLQEEVDKLKHLYSGAMKAVKGLKEENERLKIALEKAPKIIEMGKITFPPIDEE